MSYVLVVDDDNTLLKFFKIHLNKFFSRVLVVKNAKEAIATLKEKEIDLVISDIRMSRMDGIQLMKKIRRFDPTIPVFLVSGALLSDDQKEEVDTKADGFLRKPFSIDELHEFIDCGMKFRDVYKKVHDIVTDKKKFTEIIRGKRDIKTIKNEDERKKVFDLMESLKGLTTTTDGQTKSA